MKLKRILIFILALTLLLPAFCCSGTVRAASMIGDMDGNGSVTDADAVYLLRYTLFPQQYPISGNGDFDQNGMVTDADAIYLLRHTLFPENFPLTQEIVKLTVGVPNNAFVLDFENNALTSWIEETCGVELDFVLYSTNNTDILSQISNTISARQELPDILWNINLGESNMRLYGQNGYLKNLSAYYADKTGASKNFWTRMGELTQAEQDNIMRKLQVSDANNAIYSVPTVTRELASAPYQVWINTEWLDKIGMDKPTNVVELLQVLQAFKDGDCNGNGVKDEIPLFGSTRVIGSHVINWIINMFVYYDPASPYLVDSNGNLVRVETTEEYREALKFIYKLQKDGLLNSMVFTAAPSELKMLVTPAFGTALCGIFLGNLETCTTVGNEVLLQYEALPLWGYAPAAAPTVTQNNYITGDCENVGKAFEVLMAMMSQEGSYRVRYGEKGVNWDDPDNGAYSSYGLPATLKIYDDVLKKQNTAIWGKTACIFDLNAAGETVQISDSEQSWTVYRNTLSATYTGMYQEAAANNPEVLCPILVPTKTEQNALSAERSMISNCISRASTEFCMGSKDPNNESAWTSYLNELNDAGLQSVIAQDQAIYNRSK